MDAGDAMGRGERAPLLRQISYRSFKRKPSRGPRVLDETPEVELLEDKKKMGSKAPAVVLGFECLESTAFNGISTNLVVYLETVLHGSNLASASNVTTWFGTSYLTPIFGAIIADTFWGNYNTILVSLAVYLLGMIVVTLTAFMPAPAEVCTPGSSCVTGTATLPFIGLYLVAIGSGGVRSSLLPFGAEQFDDVSGVEDQEGKRSFFSLFYLCVDFGPIVSGVFIVWIQQNVSWGLGFGISTLCIALAYGGFVYATPMYKRSMPTGTPLKSLCQVVVAAFRKVSLTLPFDADHLYDVSGDSMDPHARIAHTTEFRFLDRAAIISDSELEDRLLDAHSSSWTLCTVTQVEELKILLRLLPIWATSIVISAAYSQMNTTFILQGSAMDINILSVSIPAASLSSFEVLCVLAWVLLYSNLIVPALNNFSSSGGHWEPSQLQRMGAGRVLMALAMAVAALVEMKRLDSVATGEVIGIAWQLPQYFLLAGAEVFCYIAQLEFFYGEAPDSMKSMCTSLALLTIALGSYMSSLIYAVLAAITVKPGTPGWISDDLNQGHLDYFFWSMAVMCILNFAVYSAFARNYKLKTILS